MKKRVLLVGGFNKANSLSQSLISKGYKVTIINNNYDDCTVLAQNKKVSVIYGDGTKPFVLEDAGADECDIAIALTRRDDDNLVICELCKKKFNIRKTVSIVNDPRKTEFFHSMKIDSVVSAINAITNIIEQQAFLDEIATFIPIGKGHISIMEVEIPHGSVAAQKKIWEINLPKEVIIGCVLRGDNSLVPRGDTRILEGDILVIICSKENQEEAIRKLTRR